jgi:DNA-binding IclR family transcriptional regulator
MAESPTRVLVKLRAVLDCFVPDNRPLTLTQVSKRTGMPLSTTQRLLQSLVAEGFLARTDTSYRLGLDLIGWAEAARRGVSLVSIARPSMEELRDVSGETVTLLVREGLRRVCVELVPSRHAVSQNVVPGEVHPLQAGAPSKVLLAWDPETTEQLLAAGLRHLTEATITDPETFRLELHRVVERGYAESHGENVDGVASISAPIFDASGRIAAALCVGGPAARITPDFVVTQRVPLVNTAKRVSRMLGWRGDAAPDGTVRLLTANLGG